MYRFEISKGGYVIGEADGEDRAEATKKLSEDLGYSSIKQMSDDSAGSAVEPFQATKLYKIGVYPGHK